MLVSYRPLSSRLLIAKTGLAVQAVRLNSGTFEYVLVLCYAGLVQKHAAQELAKAPAQLHSLHWALAGADDQPRPLAARGREVRPRLRRDSNGLLRSSFCRRHAY